MTECDQHYRFIGGDILQTRRDQKRFYTITRTPPSPVDAAPQAPIRKAGIRNMD